jgi:hypothetical protein
MAEGVEASFVYIPKSDEELETLAWDIVGGKVFGSWDVPEGESPQMCFLPMMLMSRKQIDEMKRHDIAQWYEYLSQAGPRGVNGMPMFMSVKLLNRQDTAKLAVRVGELVRLRKERTDGAKKEG